MKALLSLRSFCFCCVVVFGVNQRAQADEAGRVAPPTVDLKKYAGRWYEIAHQPNDYESDCLNSSARYVALSPTEIRMETTCHLADGSYRILAGTGIVTNPAEPGKLEVMLPFDIRDDYWISALDPKYRWSVVEARNNESLVILSRTRRLSSSALKEILAGLTDEDYDVSQLVYDRY